MALKSFQNAIVGTWTALAPSFEGDTERALGLVEGLLDCYGVITREIAVHAHVPGALGGIYPVLRAMEDAGDLIRGLFIDDLGPAQFCEHETLERIRATAAHGENDDIADHAKMSGDEDDKAKYAHEDESARGHFEDAITVIAAEDPIWLYGNAVPWPEIAFETAGDSPTLDVTRLTVRQKKAPGSLLVVHCGSPTLLASAKLKNLIAFTTDDALLTQSVQALLAHTERALKSQGSAGSRTKIQIETLNGIPVNDTPLAETLRDLGLVWTPEGFRFYVNPF